MGWRREKHRAAQGQMEKAGMKRDLAMDRKEVPSISLIGGKKRKIRHFSTVPW